MPMEIQSIIINSRIFEISSGAAHFKTATVNPARVVSQSKLSLTCCPRILRVVT